MLTIKGENVINHKQHITSSYKIINNKTQQSLQKTSINEPPLPKKHRTFNKIFR